MHLLEKKIGLIVGLGNEMSIAYGVSKNCLEHGSKLVASYLPIMKDRVCDISTKLGMLNPCECDLNNDESIDKLRDYVLNNFGKIDFLLHAVAFANKKNLSGKCYDISREDFLLAMNSSVYSFIGLVKKIEPIINNEGSIVTLTYYGGEKVVPNYNVMGIAKAALESGVKYLSHDLGERGIRVNSISSGSIRTLASSAIGGFKNVLSFAESNTPLKRNVNSNDVGRTAVYLFSDLSSGVTGENIHVDSGYHTVGMPCSLID